MRVIWIYGVWKKMRNAISLTQLQDKIPTVTEKVFINFLSGEIESIGLKIKN
jgi:hypothetical protein